MNGTEPVKGL